MGPVVLIAGGTRGLGLSLARELSRRGARVYLVGRPGGSDPEPEPGFRPRVLRLDLDHEDSAGRAVGLVQEQEGCLDAAVFAAGGYALAGASETSPELLAHLLRTNVESAWRFALGALPALRRSRGALLFYGVSGTLDLRARRAIPGHAAAKAALTVLARSLALEEGPRGVRVNVLAPGLLPHEESALPPDPAWVARVPLGRVGSPEEAALAGAWLLSPEASYVTGAVLEFSGGYPP